MLDLYHITDLYVHFFLSFYMKILDACVKSVFFRFIKETNKRKYATNPAQSLLECLGHYYKRFIISIYLSIYLSVYFHVDFLIF